MLARHAERLSVVEHKIRDALWRLLAQLRLPTDDERKLIDLDGLDAHPPAQCVRIRCELEFSQRCELKFSRHRSRQCLGDIGLERHACLIIVGHACGRSSAILSSISRSLTLNRSISSCAIAGSALTRWKNSGTLNCSASTFVVRSRGGTARAFLDHAHFADKLAREDAAENDR